MTELKGETTVLKTLEREDCKKLWREHEVDQELPTQQIEPGRSIEQAEDWFEDIQKK